MSSIQSLALEFDASHTGKEPTWKVFVSELRNQHELVHCNIVFFFLARSLYFVLLFHRVSHYSNEG